MSDSSDTNAVVSSRDFTRDMIARGLRMPRRQRASGLASGQVVKLEESKP